MWLVIIIVVAVCIERIGLVGCHPGGGEGGRGSTPATESKGQSEECGSGRTGGSSSSTPTSTSKTRPTRNTVRVATRGCVESSGESVRPHDATVATTSQRFTAVVRKGEEREEQEMSDGSGGEFTRRRSSEGTRARPTRRCGGSGRTRHSGVCVCVCVCVYKCTEKSQSLSINSKTRGTAVESEILPGSMKSDGRPLQKRLFVLIDMVVSITTSGSRNATKRTVDTGRETHRKRGRLEPCFRRPIGECAVMVVVVRSLGWDETRVCML
jgi:hypothetical protein